MKRKLELNQCTKCKRTYDLKVVNASIDTCSHCNEKYKDELRKKDSLRKSLNREDSISINLERLSKIV